jgi:hypothetical protein
LYHNLYQWPYSDERTFGDNARKARLTFMTDLPDDTDELDDGIPDELRDRIPEGEEFSGDEDDYPMPIGRTHRPPLTPEQVKNIEDEKWIAENEPEHPDDEPDIGPNVKY